MKSTLRQIIFDQQAQTPTDSVTRTIDQQLVNNSEILVLSGVRRCGKSTLMQQIRKSRNEKDYYLNFDDERLLNFKVDDFQILHEVFIELFGEQKTFYFDEIQNIKGWERFVRRLYDSGNKVFVTGSNASMLSKELGTHLTGRYCQYELYPFSFPEYLTYKNIQVTKKDFYSTQGKALLLRELMQYIKDGGFPQYIANKQDDYLRSLYESILYRDVMVRNNITNEHELREMVFFLASNAATLSSYNSLTKVIGIKNATTIKNYIDFLQNTYFLFQTNKFDYSLKTQIQNPKKTYFIDTAIIKKLGFSFSENIGRLMENIVFIELKRRKHEIFYHYGKFECDFIIREQNIITAAIQVCFNFENDETKKREINGLVDALNTYNLSHGTIITADNEETFSVNERSITIIPLWKWLFSID